MAKTLKIGSVGLGRLGYEHAKNIANYVTGAELTAICDTDMMPPMPRLRWKMVLT